jgi:hypothetical protein
MNAEPTITQIEGGYRVAIGPWPIIDVRTQRAAEDIANVLDRFSDLSSMTGADLCMCAGHTPIICIG